MLNKDLCRGAALLLAALLVLSGCATIDDGYRDPRDPLESYNRAMHSFNEELDKAIIKPIAEGYRTITPKPVDRGITNFFTNLDDVTSAINNLLQFKLHRAASDVGRVLVNSTIGILGFFDVATNMDMPRYDEDFGQTMGAWGVGPGPYFVLPILGPSSIRDTFGLVADWYTDPVRHVKGDDWRYGLVALRGIDTRADLLTASKVLDEAALDPYDFTRDAYLQKRRNDVYDDNPPPEPEEE